MGTKARRSNLSFSIHYAFVQALYWLIFCLGISFISVILLDRGYTNSIIGVILAISNVLAVVLQPLVSSFADKHPKIEIKNIAVIIMGLSVIMATILIFTKEKSLLTSIAATLLLVLITLYQPLVNALSIAYEVNGVVINFGLTRAGGSIGYSIISFTMGALLKFLPVIILPISTAIFLIIMMIVTYLFKRPKVGIIEHTEKENKEAVAQSAKSLPAFMKEKKRLMLLTFGLVLVLFNHALVSNYLLQIIQDVGGDSSHMGVAAGIAAVIEVPAMFIFDFLRKKFGCTRLMRFIMLGFFVKNLVVLFGTSVGLVYVSMALQIISFGLYIPCVFNYFNKVSGPADAVKGQSLYTSGFCVSTVFASLSGGWILDAYGAKAMLTVGLVLTIIGTIVVNLALEEVD